VVWDYAPFGGEMCGGSLVNFSDNAATFVQPGPDRIGRKYVKALYVEYTDGTFKEKKVLARARGRMGAAAGTACGSASDARCRPHSCLRAHPAITPRTSQRRAPAWEHLGVLGPVIRGVVGDTLRVTFKNNLREQPVSMHPHGVWYGKDSEGAPYADGLPRERRWLRSCGGSRGGGRLRSSSHLLEGCMPARPLPAPVPWPCPLTHAVAAGDKLEPGDNVTYTWLVPERAGPGRADLGSAMWMYHR
jgi:hephaestin